MDRQEILSRIEGAFKVMRFDTQAITVASSRVGAQLSDIIPESTVVMQDTGNDREVSGSVFVEGIKEIQFRFTITD